jgi:hypothetical protein
MQYFRGEVLGLFCGELGIHSDSRVAIHRFRHTLRVWDLAGGIEFHLNFQTNILSAEPRPTPEHCRPLFRQPDSTLLARVADPDLMPWCEERETILSELSYRGIAHARRPYYPIRLLSASLLTQLIPRLNPLRLLRRPDYGSSPF